MGTGAGSGLDGGLLGSAGKNSWRRLRAVMESGLPQVCMRLRYCGPQIAHQDKTQHNTAQHRATHGRTTLSSLAYHRMALLCCDVPSCAVLCCVRGADPGQDPTPKGGGTPPPPLQTPKWLYRTMCFVGAGGAGDFVLGRWQGEFFLFDPMCLYSKYSEFCENSKMAE